MTIPLQTTVVYGPLSSRRFGSSLGINLLPSGKKVCNFDCGYCQYGEAETLSPALLLPSVDEIEGALKEFDAMQDRPPLDWIMLSGNGEPTLHPDFPVIVDRLKTWREKSYPDVPIGILSNSSTCGRPVIHDALAKLDGRFMKLDAGNERIFWRLNQPNPPWVEIISGLFHLKKVVLQSLFVQGSIDNTSPESVDDWIRAVAYIHPESVQIYTLDRPPRDEGLRPVLFERLHEIASQLTRQEIKTEVFGEKKA